jgi:hypothetical protein
MLSYESLENYFNSNYTLMHYHKYSWTELENMIPWERDVYIDYLHRDLDKRNSQET